MNAWCKTAIVLYSAVVLLAAGCGRQELPGPPVKQQDTDPPKQNANPREVVMDNRGLVESIHGIFVNFPDSEKLTWVEVTDSNSVDPKIVAVGQANVPPALAEKYTLRATRFATIGDYWLLSGRFDPPSTTANYTWVVDKRTMKYVGRFFDKNSR